MSNIIINREICNGCKICFKSCFIDILKWDEATQQPIVSYPEECVHCLFCEINCPQRAVKVIPDYSSYQFPRENIL